MTAILHIGDAVPRLEDGRLLRGAAQFVDDLNFPNQAYGCVVRSTKPHARLRCVATAAALAAPGVIAVLTGVELAADGIGTLPNIIRRRCRDGTDMVEPPYPILAQGRVRHVGEAIAFVVAETASQALDATELVDVDYDDLPAVAKPDDALRLGAPALWNNVPGNEAFYLERGDRAGTDAAFAGAAHRARISLVIPRVASCALEPRGAIGTYDDVAGTWCLYASVQKPHLLRGLLANSVFCVPEARVQVVAPQIGGSFGTKGLLHPELPLVLWAARRLGRPVKWIATRSEAFLSDYAGRDNLTTAELAMDRDGRFLGLRVSTIANLGAYLSSYGTHSSTNNLLGLLGTYTTPVIHVEVVGVYTNSAPTGPYRGAGRPEASYVIERLIDVVAAQSGLDRLEIRRRNLIQADAMPFRTALDFTYDSGNFAYNMARALEVAGADGFTARRDAARRRGRLRGLGLANCLEIAGPIAFEERATVRIDRAGNATLFLGTDSHGQGHETVFTQLASDMLGLAVGAIRIASGDTRIVAKAHGSFGSRSACVGGSALVLAIQDAIEKAREAGARILGVTPANIAFARGRFQAAGSGRGLGWSDVASADGLVGDGLFAPDSPTYPNGCHVCEVEIDPETGTIAILNYVVVDDVGRVLNPLVVEGQLHGGIAQGIGEAILEAVCHDRDAQLLTGSLMDYALPRASDLPSFVTETCPVPTLTNPLGVKGVGEAGIVGAMPAIVNAVCAALAPLGIHHLDMPLTPLRVWSAIQSAASGKAKR
ncbi:MAG: xanthine dehydrogenase family protein molybdopterin-binding subunit [Alphaproteobacteria bacterium]|nr:xanthine dehydrogenase family protein molybdopterin-binding subunit [Alphaproteobacteria bacterium]